jgi:hypothetical protein
MTLEKFAKNAGLTIIRCSEEWGGTFGYVTKDAPNTKIVGFKKEEMIYKSWLISTFGENTAKAIIKLLKQTEK